MIILRCAGTGHDQLRQRTSLVLLSLGVLAPETQSPDLNRLLQAGPRPASMLERPCVHPSEGHLAEILPPFRHAGTGCAMVISSRLVACVWGLKMGFLRLARPARGIAAFILAFALCMLASPDHARESTRRVFLLHGLDATDASVQGTGEAIKTRLRERSAEHVEVYSDFLDLERFKGPANEARLVEFLKARFAQVNPDLVIPIGRNAVDFVIRRR